MTGNKFRLYQQCPHVRDECEDLLCVKGVKERSYRDPIASTAIGSLVRSSQVYDNIMGLH